MTAVILANEAAAAGSAGVPAPDRRWSSRPIVGALVVALISKRRPELAKQAAVLFSLVTGALTIGVAGAVRRATIPGFQLVDERPVAREPRHLLDARRRRHLAVARGAHRDPVPDRHARRAAAPRRRSRSTPGSLRARGGLHRCLPRARPVPVLRRSSRSCWSRCTSSSAAGATASASTPPPSSSSTRCSARPSCWSASSRWPYLHADGGLVTFDLADDRRPSRAIAGRRPPARWLFLVVRHRLRGQGAAVPVPHLAARRPHRGAHRRLGDPGRRHAQARHLRLPALRPATCSPRPRLYFAPALVTLGVIGIIYGAVCATMQKDLKRLVAYSSVAHLGFIVLGTFALTTPGPPGRASCRWSTTASPPAPCSCSSA